MEIKAGSTFGITLNVQGSKGLNTIQSQIEFDPVFSVTSETTVHSELADQLIKVEKLSTNSLSLVLQVKPGKADIDGDRELCLTPFKVSDNAEGVYKIEFNIEKSFALGRSSGESEGAKINTDWRGAKLNVSQPTTEKMIVFLKVVK